MADVKTKPTRVTAAEFIARIPDPVRRADAGALVKIFKRVTGEPPVMWGPSIIGFGSYHYKYESGREGDMCLVGFSPRSTAFVVYVHAASIGEARLARLGKHKLAGGCLHVKRLADIDVAVLEQLVRATADHTRSQHDASPRPKRAVSRITTPKQPAPPTAKPSRARR